MSAHKEVDAAAIRRDLELGFTVREVAKRHKLSHGTIGYYRTKFEMTTHRPVESIPVEPIRRPKKAVKEREKTVCGPRKHPWVAENIRVTDGGSLMCFQCARREALKRMPEYMRKLAVS